MLGGNFHGIHTLEGADTDAERGRAQVIQRTGRVLLGQPLLDQALQVAVRRGTAGACAPGHLTQAQFILRIGQYIQEPRSDRHRLNGAGTLLARALRLRVGGGLQSVQRGYLLISGFSARHH